MADLKKIKEQVRILDIAKELGFTITKAGSYYSLKEHDSVRIDDNKNLFIQNSGGAKGSVIDFTLTFSHLNLKDSIKYLDGILSGYEPKNNVYKAASQSTFTKKELILPNRANKMSNIYAYLINTRNIDKDIVSEFIKDKMLYQDDKNNCIFVSPSTENPLFACKRGTNTYKKFIADLPGNDYNHCFFIDNKSSKLIVCESVIDAMSIMSLKKNYLGENYKNYNYLALSGVAKSEMAINYHLNKNRYTKLICCTDSDIAGNAAAEKIKEITMDFRYDIEFKRDMPYGKDFNDTLKLVSDENSVEHIKMLYKKEFNFMTPNDIEYHANDLYEEYSHLKENNQIDMSFNEFAKIDIDSDKKFFEKIEQIDAAENLMANISDKDIKAYINNEMNMDFDEFEI